MYTCIHVYMYTCIHIYIYTYIHIFTYIYIYLSMFECDRIDYNFPCEPCDPGFGYGGVGVRNP